MGEHPMKVGTGGTAIPASLLIPSEHYRHDLPILTILFWLGQTGCPEVKPAREPPQLGKTVSFRVKMFCRRGLK
jgi:hypothetical protein